MKCCSLIGYFRSFFFFLFQDHHFFRLMFSVDNRGQTVDDRFLLALVHSFHQYGVGAGGTMHRIAVGRGRVMAHLRDRYFDITEFFFIQVPLLEPSRATCSNSRWCQIGISFDIRSYTVAYLPAPVLGMIFFRILLISYTPDFCATLVLPSS